MVFGGFFITQRKIVSSIFKCNLIICTRCEQKITDILNFFQKVLIYLSITSLSSYASVFSHPRNTSETGFLVSLTDPVSIFPLSLNRSKTLSVHQCLQFWEEEKVIGGQVR